MLCIFAATIFWFLNALNKNYTTNVTFPVSFDFDHQYYVATKPLPEHVRLNVTGVGWNLFRRSAGLKVPPLVVPLEKPSDVKKIVGTTLPAFFSNQLEDIQINFVLTDTVYLDIEPRAGRWITLMLDSVSRYLQTNHEVTSKITISPDSIFIDGPISQVSRLKEPYNVTLSSERINEDFTEEVEVQIPNGDLIQRRPPVVFVAFSVERMVQVEDSVKLEVVNFPANASPSLGTEHIRCIFKIRQSMQQSFTTDSVTAVIDLKNFKRGQAKFRPVLLGLPLHTEVVYLDSVSVKF